MPVTGFDPDSQDGGIILGGESSALPRGYGISLLPIDPGTKTQVTWLAQIEGWPRKNLMFNVSKLRENLQITGRIDRKKNRRRQLRVPEGRYHIKLRVNGIRFNEEQPRIVRITEGGTEELTFDEVPEQHRFELNEEFGKFDENTRRILEDSTLDNLPAEVWIGPTVLHRDRRKACLMNILAKLAVVPSVRQPLSRYLRNIRVVEEDRIYAEVAPRFFDNVKEVFLPKDGTVHKSHKRLLRRIFKSNQDHVLHSYREDRGTGSLQIVGAVPKKRKRSHDPRVVRFVDIDIDGANPSYDLARFIIHAGHLFGGKRIDHFALRGNILRQSGDFLYYRVMSVGS